MIGVTLTGHAEFTRCSWHLQPSKPTNRQTMCNRILLSSASRRVGVIVQTQGQLAAIIGAASIAYVWNARADEIGSHRCLCPVDLERTARNIGSRIVRGEADDDLIDIVPAYA